MVDLDDHVSEGRGDQPGDRPLGAAFPRQSIDASRPEIDAIRELMEHTGVGRTRVGGTTRSATVGNAGAQSDEVCTSCSLLTGSISTMEVTSQA